MGVSERVVLTVHGGMTSHAAVVARGMGKPCVVGCDDLRIDGTTATIGGHKLREGDVISIDGGTGRVFIGEVPLVPPQINEDFETILRWANDVRRLQVRANADNPEDAARAQARIIRAPSRTTTSNSSKTTTSNSSGR